MTLNDNTKLGKYCIVVGPQRGITWTNAGYHQMCYVFFTWEQLNKYAWKQSATSVRRLQVD